MLFFAHYGASVLFSLRACGGRQAGFNIFSSVIVIKTIIMICIVFFKPVHVSLIVMVMVFQSDFIYVEIYPLSGKFKFVNSRYFNSSYSTYFVRIYH